MFDIEIEIYLGLRVYFKISEKIGLLKNDESVQMDFYFSTICGHPHIPGFTIESINVILSKNVEMNAEPVAIPLFSQKYFAGNSGIPCKDEIIRHCLASFQNERISKAKTILQKIEKCYGTRISQKMKNALNR